jgi:quercetin dioxygenase-like cupin family protein
MSNSIQHSGPIREAGRTVGDTLFFDLNQEVEHLNLEQPWQAEHTAKTLAKYPDFRLVLVALRAGARLREHRTAGRISIHTLAGRLLIRSGDKAIDLSSGALLTIDRNVAHDVEALSNSVFLLTIAWPERSNTRKEGD